MSEEEDRFLKKSESVKTFYASELRESLGDVTKGIVSSLSGNVYVTIDLDAFDPGIMPSVGTPEPGGLGWFEAIDILRDVMLSNCGIVGFDIMELSPIPGDRDRTSSPPSCATHDGMGPREARGKIGSGPAARIRRCPCLRRSSSPRESDDTGSS
jgi:hypothetical protein